MLTLDHINDDGAKQRKKKKLGTGTNVYAFLNKHGYPPGYQTLCCNHQLKKHLALVRLLAEERYPVAAIRPRRVFSFSLAERKRRRRRALGKRASIKTRMKQSRSQRRRARRPGEHELLIKRSRQGADEWKARWKKMTESERNIIRSKISLKVKASWARRHESR